MESGQETAGGAGRADAVGRLLGRALGGDRTSLARAISLVENEAPEARRIQDAVFPLTGTGMRLGVTGPPGAGKSTLVSRLAAHYRAAGERVAVVAVDPTSPFSGGALLGDRVRMTELSGDEGLFIRSMASRGSLGGLAVTTSEVCDLLEAAGYQRLLVETVGVGQSELEVAETVDSVLVVLVPESGDGVQAMKAGLMEIGDLFVLNKADREGAERAAQDLRAVLGLKRPTPERWNPPVVTTVARTGQGVPALAEHVERHLEHLRAHHLLAARRRLRLRTRLGELIHQRAALHLGERIGPERWEAVLGGLERRELSPHQAAAILWREAWPDGAAAAGGPTSKPRERGTRA